MSNFRSRVVESTIRLILMSSELNKGLYQLVMETGRYMNSDMAVIHLIKQAVDGIMVPNN